MKNITIYSFALFSLFLGIATSASSQIDPPSYEGVTEICTGQSASILAAGLPGASYSWWDSDVSGNLLGVGVVFTTDIFHEVGQTSIFLEQTVGFETSTRTEIEIIINLTPTITSTTPDIACAGSTLTLSAAGAETYLWSPGGLFGSPEISVSGETQIFSVVGTSSEGCQSESIDVLVQVPQINASADIDVCEGDDFELTASGGDGYTWEPSGQTGESVTLQASTTTTYVVSGTFSDNGCVAQDEVIVTVNPNPIVSASTNTPVLASGELALLNSSSDVGSAFRWDSDHGPANMIGEDAYANPTTTTTYISTHESIHGCTGSATVSVTVNPVPETSGVTTVCASDGFSTSLNAISSSGNAISWYDSENGASIYDGNSLDLSGIDEIVNDFWVSEDGGVNRKNIHIYAPSPINLLTDNIQGFALPNRTLCSGQTALLSADLIGNVEQINWYLESEESAFASTLPGNPTPVSPVDTTNYWVEGYGQQQEIIFGYNGTMVGVWTPVNGSYQTWVVPEGVYSIEVDAWGASSSYRSGQYACNGYHGGNGGRVEAVMDVTPGETLYIFVGGHGKARQNGSLGFSGPNGQANNGGWNGGGHGSHWGGGGATDIRIGGTELHHRVLVAGGGGGPNNPSTCSAGSGGPGGGLIAPGDGGDQGGTQTHGGNTQDANPGGWGYGGSGSFSGGGGGWYGGSTSKPDTKAGGGSSYTNPQYFHNLNHTIGYRKGHGRLIIRYGKNDCTSPKVPLVLNVTSELDALGICGGLCQEDLDSDGVCDDEDACVGYFDVCGVCNGPGDIYECGCADIAEFSCDCDGGTYDALGLCGGTCLYDFDQDGGCNVNGVSSFCEGEGTTLTAVGPGSYVWWDALEGGNVLSSVDVYQTPTYTEAGTYYVYLQRSIDGVAEARVPLQLTVKENPSVSVSAQSLLVCQGQQTTLFAAGADSYVWSPGNYQGFPTVELNESQSFSVIGTTAGCSSAPTPLEITVPKFDDIADETICFGDEIEISVSGATYFTWPDGVVANARLLAPTETTTYLVTGTHNEEECNSQREFVINVNPTPITEVSGDQTIGEGEITTISATSDFAEEYHWSVASGPYGVSGSTINISPTETTTFIAEGFSNLGCSSTASLTISVQPRVEIEGETNLCLLSNGFVSTSLTAVGSGQFAWYDAEEGGNLLFIGETFHTGNISSTTTYWISENFGPRRKVTVYVNGSEMSLNVDDDLLCSGESAILTAETIGGTVSWYENPMGEAISAVQSGDGIVVTPSETTTYYAQGTIDQTEVRFDANVINNCLDGSCYPFFTGTTNGTYQTWIVPDGVYSLEIDARGASQGISSGQYGTGNPGKGGRVEATMSVTPGDMLYIFVGGHGEIRAWGGYGTAIASSGGGWNGGGTSGGSAGNYSNAPDGGGGATDIRIGGLGLHNRVLVAGGGGGATSSAGTGGHGGGLEAPGAGGGTQTHGGTTGTGSQQGSFGQGGSGGSGGGGGGLFGGSCGYGGSSYTNPQYFLNVTHTVGYQSYHGELIIRYGVQDCLTPMQSLTVEVTDELDIFDVCGGGCAEDADSDGICDTDDECVGVYDNCGVCNGPGSVYNCGCFEMPESDCNCYGAQFDALGVCDGSCVADLDQDGICDDVDDCVGEYDDCGVCNGPGAVFECGCEDGGCTDPTACNFDPNAACDNGNCLFVSGCMEPTSCNYNLAAQCDDGSCTQLDALGVCGGGCSSDNDGDGICDSEDSCVGSLDACGVCNGPGPVFECGCEDGGCTDPAACNFDPGAACDNGTCGYVTGCTDPGACNFDVLAVCDDGSCYSNCTMTSLASSTSPPPYGAGGIMFAVNATNTIHIKSLSFLINHVSGGSAAKPYSIYVRTNGMCDVDPDDDGICDAPFSVPSSSYGWQLLAQGVTQATSWYGFYTAAITEEFFLEVPAGESYGIYITSPQGVITSYGGAGHDNNGPLGSIVSSNSDLQITNGFAIGSSGLFNCGYCMGTQNDPDGIGTARFTGGVNYCRAVDGCMDSGACNFNPLANCDPLDECQFPDGCTDPVACNYSYLASCDDGSCNFDCTGCTDPAACNYDATATQDDGSCLVNDDCGVCNGPGSIYECGCADIPVGDCDCDGNQLDAIEVCGGSCSADADADGLCDDLDDCVGAYDACGVCNGPGSIYECGCADIPEGDCDCNGNVLDECGVCNGPGSIYECGCADIPVGDCDCDGNQLDAIEVCGGSCSADADADGLCDDLDDCVGAYDACGVCNGPGSIYECGCADIPEGDCDCNGNVLDECGVCNGPGSIYECGCADIPVGDCDCDGNQLDAIEVCGGSCSADADADGLCDDVDDCVGAYDACGVCNGLGEIYECGCTGIPEGDCDCFGNQLDGTGVCGGVCDADVDADGICDAIDDCVGAYDACGVCNGPGEIYECGCADISEGDCDCDGNQLDDCAICGGEGGCIGCTDELAMNFLETANQDDGSCVYSMDFVIDAYNEGYDLGTSECNDESSTCAYDFDGSGVVDTADLLMFLSDFGDSCE